jgi:Ran GTPase-activating protein (RanGAP) involved in mRNA processing and transport
MKNCPTNIEIYLLFILWVGGWYQVCPQADVHCSLNHINCSLNQVNRSLNHVNCSLNQVLSLKHNSISDLGVKAVAQMLEKNLALKRLNLANNHIGAVGALSLASVLRTTTTLQRLDVSHNGLERGGLEIASALGSNQSLVCIDLSYTRASQDVCLVVVEALRVNTVLDTNQPSHIQQNNKSK